MGEKPRCSTCGRILTALYRQRRGPPKKPGELGKLATERTRWLECEHCGKVYDAGARSETKTTKASR